MTRSQAWKELERTVAEKLGGKRVLRGADFSEKAIDVDVPDFPHFKIDAKYKAKQGWKHHAYLRELRESYCEAKTDVPILVTKNGREHGACVTMRLEDFAGLLTALRGARLVVRLCAPNPETGGPSDFQLGRAPPGECTACGEAMESTAHVCRGGV